MDLKELLLCVGSELGEVVVLSRRVVAGWQLGEERGLGRSVSLLPIWRLVEGGYTVHCSLQLLQSSIHLYVYTCMYTRHKQHTSF